MAVTPENRIVKALQSYADNGGTSNGHAAYLFGQTSTLDQMAGTLDLLFHIVRQLAELDMDGHVSPQKADIYLKANAVRDALVREGYVFR